MVEINRDMLHFTHLPVKTSVKATAKRLELISELILKEVAGVIMKSVRTDKLEEVIRSNLEGLVYGE